MAVRVRITVWAISGKVNSVLSSAAAAAKAERLGASPRTIVGGPATVATALRAYGDAGADWVVLGPIDSSDPENPGLIGEVRERLGG